MRLSQVPQFKGLLDEVRGNVVSQIVLFTKLQRIDDIGLFIFYISFIFTASHPSLIDSFFYKFYHLSIIIFK